MHIDQDEMRKKVRDHRVVVLDVLTREAYAKAHIPRAVNIPLAELRERAPDLLPDRDREIVVYCGGPT